LRRDFAPSLCRAVAERYGVGALFQPPAPHREAVTIPAQNFEPIFPPAGERKPVTSEGIQLQVLAHPPAAPMAAENARLP